MNNNLKKMLGSTAIVLMTGFIITPINSAVCKEVEFEKKQVEISSITISQEKLSQERETNAYIENFYKDLKKQNRIYETFGNENKQEIDLRRAALKALIENLSIKRSGVQKQIAKQAIEEAKAVFDPVINFTITGSNVHYFTRTEYDYKYKKGTDANNRVYMPEGSPVKYLQYNAPRPAGYYMTKVKAVTKPLAGHSEQMDFITNVSQTLPWGQSFNINLDAKYKPRYWIENGDVPTLAVTGQYKRPWTTDISGSFSTPMWGAKEFGENNSQNMNLDLSKLNNKLAMLSVEEVINNTLLEVDSAYWDLVLAVKNLKIAQEVYVLSSDLMAKTNRLYKAQLINKGNMAQVSSSLQFVKANRENAFRDVLKASNSLSKLLNFQHGVRLNPVGYMGLLEKEEDYSFVIDDVLENPEHMSALVNMAIAKRVQKTRENQTKPDITINASIAGNQSDSVFGYEDVIKASERLFAPDKITTSAGVSYYRPIFNSAAKAALDVSNQDVKLQNVLYKKVKKSLENSFNNAKISLQSAKKRSSIANKNVELATSLYQRAKRLQKNRKVREYEVTTRLIELLNAKKTQNSALIEVKKAQANLLASVGALSKRYGEKIAQTVVDEKRIETLSKTGAVKHFVGGKS